MNQGKEPSMKVLKKGTLVKHGTTSRSLQGIFDQGIQPKAHHYHFRSTIEEAPAAEMAVYVGQHMAYCAAMLSFLDLMRFSQNNQSAIPIVINIRLGEDCQVVADEDFVLLDKYDENGNLSHKYKNEFLRAIQEEGVSTWEGYGSAGVIHPDGIPVNWIESFEHPLLELRSTPEIYSDIELMLLGYLQQQDGLSLKEILDHIHKFKIVRKEFSRRHDFTSEGVEAYRNQELLKNISGRDDFCRELRGALVNLGTEKHGLPFYG